MGAVGPPHCTQTPNSAGGKNNKKTAQHKVGGCVATPPGQFPSSDSPPTSRNRRSPGRRQPRQTRPKIDLPDRRRPSGPGEGPQRMRGGRRQCPLRRGKPRRNPSEVGNDDQPTPIQTTTPKRKNAKNAHRRRLRKAVAFMMICFDRNEAPWLRSNAMSEKMGRTGEGGLTEMGLGRHLRNYNMQTSVIRSSHQYGPVRSK
jgi:hypothetical protein